MKKKLPIDTSDQFLKFYKQKGLYLVELSENHFKNREYKKTLELLKQAHVMFQKGSYTEEAEKTKQRFAEIKEKFFKKSS